MLKETSRAIVVNATAEAEEFVYNVEYKVNNKQLTRLQCNVHKKETQEYVGYITNESGNTQVSFKEGIDIVPHLAVFGEILEEAKETL